MLLASAVFCMVGILLVFRMIPPNSNTGFRTGRTFSDEAVWYTVNANVGWALVLSGFVSIVVIWRVFALGIDLSAKSLVATTTLIASAILAAIVGSLS